MKISQLHFHQLQRTIEDKIKDALTLHVEKDNFGVLPYGDAGRKPLELLIRVEDKHKVMAEVVQCRGVCPAGNRIEVLASAKNDGKLVLSAQLSAADGITNNGAVYLLCIRHSDVEMTAFGKPDSEESPTRLPYAEPHLSLELVPFSANLNTYLNTLPVARFTVHNGELRHDSDYIPPCREMGSHDDLKEFGFKYIQFLAELEASAFEIVRNLGRKESLTNLAQSVETVTRGAIQTIAQHLDFMTMYGESLKPSLYLLNAKQLARNLKNSIELLANEDKEELLNYIQEVIDVGPGEYMNMNGNLLTLEYYHLDIRGSLQAILQFCKVNGKLFNEWSNLDYIGKKKKTGIFVGEVTKDTEVTKERKKWDF